MHEWALAEAVVLTAQKAAKEQGVEAVQEVTVKLGELQQIEKDVFAFAIQEIMQSQKALFQKTEIKFQSERVAFKCRQCGHEWTFGDDVKKLTPAELEAIHFVPEVAHAYMPCPRCKSPDFDIIRGRGVWIDSIVGERGK